ncbi:hypothetical protein [Aureibacter tunicatorum]|uniref:Uncharacterized protein n=1 Tax=Aureibacter tunicatorum TaxID=866807 RepID=A0AAE4BRV5_9BACT|nr:hypothetical protein [Aureibacter tunicatorum]MDR6237642.1 hypothetical protein [Aureibacter tunicatorum]BDD02677.1 hypothetical protein AUTU_01600 [Aureibacter tunicatorum]
MISVGDYIKLCSNKFRELFSKNDEWTEEMFLEQFNHVTLWFESLNCRGEYAKSIFDSSVSKVIDIEHDENGAPIFVKTTLFWIDFQYAFKTKK